MSNLHHNKFLARIFNTFLIALGIATIVFFRTSPTTTFESDLPQVRANLNYQ